MPRVVGKLNIRHLRRAIDKIMVILVVQRLGQRFEIGINRVRNKRKLLFAGTGDKGMQHAIVRSGVEHRRASLVIGNEGPITA